MSVRAHTHTVRFTLISIVWLIDTLIHPNKPVADLYILKYATPPPKNTLKDHRKLFASLKHFPIQSHESDSPWKWIGLIYQENRAELTDFDHFAWY